MTERVTDGVEKRRTPSIPTDHSRHDRLLVTRYAGNDAYPDELDLAHTLVAGCPDCAQLAADIRLIAQATAELPAARRTRDFRLTPEQAEAARGTRFERFLRRLAAPGLAPLRPVAGVALSLGLALAVVGSALPQGASVLDSSAQSVPELRFVERGIQAVEPEPGAPEPPAEYAEDLAPGAEGPAAATPQLGHPMLASEDEPVPDAADEPALEGAEAPQATPLPEPAAVDIDTAERAREAADADLFSTLETTTSEDVARSILVYGGLGVALASLGVLLLVWFARRRAHDPLLR